MEKQSECIKVKDKDGKVLLNIYPATDVVLEHAAWKEPNQGQGSGGQNGGSGKGNGNGESMTFPQKKYLFRLLAGQGIEGDKAHFRLKELFKVDSLKEVSKLEASRLIERLIKEIEGRR